ncbi:hypothetical protein Bca4012_043091 [Brassica carinata]
MNYFIFSLIIHLQSPIFNSCISQVSKIKTSNPNTHTFAQTRVFTKNMANIKSGKCSHEQTKKTLIYICSNAFFVCS